MDYRIINKPAFDIVGKTEREISEKVINWVANPETWEKFWWNVWEEFERDRRYEFLEKLTQGKPGRITGAIYLGVTTVSSGMDGFTFAIGVENPEIAVPEGYEVIHIPAATYAVFESKGVLPRAIHDMEDRIFMEWFPSTGYEHDDKPELEVYLPGDRKSEDYRCQYWLPVIKKGK